MFKTIIIIYSETIFKKPQLLISKKQEIISLNCH